MTTRLHLVGRRLARPFLRRSRLLLGHEQGERGVIAVLAALVLTVTISSAALSLDVAGRVTEVRRDQATADLAALDAVRNLLSAQTLAAASARPNDRPPYTMSRKIGRMKASSRAAVPRSSLPLRRNRSTRPPVATCVLWAPMPASPLI